MNKTHKTNKGDHSQLSSTNRKFHLKIDHPYNNNPKYPQLCKKAKEIKKEKKKDKRKELERS